MLVTPSGITTAGFGPGGLVALQSRQSEAGHGYDAALSSEPLLGDPGLVKAVFFCSDRGMVVPPPLHGSTAAEEWMRDVYGPGQWLHAQAKGGGPVAVCEVIPEAAEATSRYFANARLLPFSLIHLSKAPPAPALLRLALVDGLLLLTAFRKSALLRQACERCASAEDLAFSVAALCRDVDIPVAETMMVASAGSLADARVLDGAAAFLPNLQAGDAPPVTGALSSGIAADAWKPVVHLMYLLYACAL